MKRTKTTSVTKGACERCRATWRGRNAHMLAGKHHQDTGHPTWSQTSGGLRHRYVANDATGQGRLI